MCSLDSGNFSYESGDIAWNKDSKQYQLSLSAYVNNEGHYMIDDYYCVALGSYYGDVGTKYIITLSSGVQFKAIKFDAKADQDTVNGCYHSSDGSILEFVLSYETAFQFYGGEQYIAINLHDKWKGNIVSIETVN